MGVQQTLFPLQAVYDVGTDLPAVGLEAGNAVSAQSCGSMRKLRGYQLEIATEASDLLNAHGSCLVTMATGTGKTTVAMEVIRRALLRGGRVLWLVHREELVYSAYETLRHLGNVQIEMQSHRADGDAQIVVASKDTLRHRLRKYPQDYFGLIVTDETHHAIARTYRRIYDWFSAGTQDCAHLGLTATPDRTDRIALGVKSPIGEDLGGLFASNTRPFTIEDGIRAGWLVPFTVWRVVLGDVDTSSVRTIAGDLSPGDLSAILTVEKPLLAAAQALLERCSDRPTIGFCASVSHAERLAEILNRYRAGCARVVTGETPRGDEEGQRRWLFREFGKSYQFLLNYGVATEGTDLPIARCVAMLRMTKSRLVWTQCAGRGTRTFKGVDDVPDDPEARKAWIRASGKPDCLLLDFVGAVGSHSLVGPVDVLGGDPSPAVRELAATLTEGKATDVKEAVEKARQIVEERERRANEERERKRLAMEARRAAIKARAEYRAKQLDPLQLVRSSLGGAGTGGDSSGDTFGGPTPAQVDEARKLKLIFPEGCTKADAGAALQHERLRRSQGYASCATVRFIKQLYPRMNEGMILLLSQKRAGELIAKAKGWRKDA